MPPLHTGTPLGKAPAGLQGRDGCEEAAEPCSDPAPSALFLQLLMGCAPAHPRSCSAAAPALCRARTRLSARSLYTWARPSEFIPAFWNLLDDEYGSSAVGVS